MKAYVSTIKPASSGFGQYDRGEEVAVYGDWDSVEDYADTAASQNHTILDYAIDPEATDNEEIASALRSANGAVLGGHDTLVAYDMGPNQDGSPCIALESVRLEEESE